MTTTKATGGDRTNFDRYFGNGSLDAVWNVPRAINVTELCIVRALNVDAIEIRMAMKAFPNLERLEFGSHSQVHMFDPLINGGEIFGLLPQYFAPGSWEDLQEGWPHLNTIIIRSTLFDKAGFLAWLGFLQTSFVHLVIGSRDVQPRRFVIENCSLIWTESFLGGGSGAPLCRLPALDSNISWIKFRRALEEVLMHSFGLSVEAIAKETGGLLGTSDNWILQTKPDAEMVWKSVLETMIPSL
jgi:hypothetical protein